MNKLPLDSGLYKFIQASNSEHESIIYWTTDETANEWHDKVQQNMWDSGISGYGACGGGFVQIMEHRNTIVFYGKSGYFGLFSSQKVLDVAKELFPDWTIYSHSYVEDEFVGYAVANGLSYNVQNK